MGVSLSHGVDTCCEKVSPYQGSHFLTGITFSRNTGSPWRLHGNQGLLGHFQVSHHFFFSSFFLFFFCAFEQVWHIPKSMRFMIVSSYSELVQVFTYSNIFVGLEIFHKI